jgi:hypothetical protein
MATGLSLTMPLPPSLPVYMTGPWALFTKVRIPEDNITHILNGFDALLTDWGSTPPSPSAASSITLANSVSGLRL